MLPEFQADRFAPRAYRPLLFMVASGWVLIAYAVWVLASASAIAAQ